MQSNFYLTLLILSIVGPSHSNPDLLSGLGKATTPVTDTVNIVPKIIQQAGFPNILNFDHEQNENEHNEDEDEEETESETQSIRTKQHRDHGSKSTGGDNKSTRGRSNKVAESEGTKSEDSSTESHGNKTVKSRGAKGEDHGGERGGSADGSKLREIRGHLRRSYHQINRDMRKHSRGHPGDYNFRH